MSAVLGTWGETQVTSIVSEPTWPKPKPVGAGTAIEKREQLDSECIQKAHGRFIRFVIAQVKGGQKIVIMKE